MSTTLSHKIGIFQIAGNVIILGDFSEQESIDYLTKFMNVSFNFNGDVQSIGLQLEVPHQNRMATIILFDQPASDVIEKFNTGKRTEPMGAFQLKLRYDGQTDIWPLF
jgi:hypothetical protein